MGLLTTIKNRISPNFDSLIGNNLASVATDTKGKVVWASTKFKEAAGEDVIGLDIRDAISKLFEQPSQEAIGAVCDKIKPEVDETLELENIGFKIHLKALDFLSGKRIAATFIKLVA